ncbi:hypothetical protein AB0M36_20900 [Actinoplanes sp. NPDC051346]
MTKNSATNAGRMKQPANVSAARRATAANNGRAATAPARKATAKR